MLMIRPKTINDAALTSSSAAESAPAAWDTAVTYALNDQVAVLPRATIVNRVNMTITALGSDVYRCTKTSGGASGSFDADAVSSQSFSGDFTIRVQAGQTNKSVMIGANADPATDSSYTSLDRAIQFTGVGSLQAWENGVSSAVAGGYTTADYIFIQRVGSSVKAYKGTSINISLATLIYTFTNLTGTLYFDSSFDSTSAFADVLVSYAAAQAATPLYRSLQASNIGHDPTLSPTYWIANGYVYPTWSSSTLYALGDIITDTTAHRLYESQSGGTSATVTMTIASPCVVTSTAHGLAANTPITFTTTGALPTGLSVGTTYYVLSPTTNTFNVSATAGGAAINTSGSQSGTHAAVANPNLNKAITTASFWLDIGPSNKWAMFDTYNGTATTDAELIDFTVALTGRIDSLALFSLANAVSARIVVSTVADGTLYDHTTSLISTEGIADWYDYFFEEVESGDKLFVSGLPVYADPSIRVVITGNGTAAVECGTFAAGLSKDLGATLHDGAQVGITDYSRKDVDAFGNVTLVQRSFADRASFRMRVPKAAVDGIKKVLATFRATPAVYLGATDYGSSLVFGWYEHFDIVIDYPTYSLCSIDIQGLT